MKEIILRATTDDSLENQVCITFVGDICLAKGVEEKIKKHGIDFPFYNCLSALKSDILFGNLEVVVSEKKKQTHVNDPLWIHPSLSKGLVTSGFDILNLANNHIADLGHVGAQNTVNYLKRNNINIIGYGNNAKEAYQPALIKRKNKKVAFLGISDNWGNNVKKNSPGVAVWNEKRILKIIYDIKKAVNYIVVSLHADLEFVDYPAPSRVRFSRKLIDAGAHVVVHHHSHTPQGIEIYKNGLVAYSLGNFVFQVCGSEYLETGSPWTKYGFILKTFLDSKGIAKISILPTKITTLHQASLLKGEEANKVISHIKDISGDIKNSKLLWLRWRDICERYFSIYYYSILTPLFRKDLKRCFKNIIVFFRDSARQRWLKGFLVCSLSRYLNKRLFK